MAKNPYDILGIKKSASADEIKKAYRKLAMQWHPDKHKGDKKIETKFKDINAAYETLSDAKKRAQYDQFGDAGEQFGAGGFRPGSGGGFSAGAGGFNPGAGGGFEDLFSQFSRARTSTGSRGGKNASSFEFDLGNLFGGGGMGGAQRATPESEEEESLDVELVAEIPFLDFLLGTSVSVKTPDGATLKLSVPARTKPGTRLRVSGRGKTDGRHKGDLFVKLDAKMPKEVPEDVKKVMESLKYRL